MMNQIIVLFDGYCIEEEDVRKANCTCTLIKGHKNIIVDTMTAWDGDKLQAALQTHNIKCSEIDFVVCTHGHSDHIGCNYLFKNATHIVGYDISKNNIYFDHDFAKHKYVIHEDVYVMATPGHTMQDVSVVIKNKEGITIIAGDLFENEEDLDGGIEAILKTGSVNPDIQMKNRNMVLEIADYIIPGHGPMFKNLRK